ncbi:serine hydrolase [Croceibacterium sp. LX-88]|uniref:Serine hydrolase n=1 Tax=Croceibacterium selenioxidans TaxID=2838833 RepID=A0ABS5W3L2_9SPHN|nr:serine hydrolase [Croceibacterium selenioxidans]
MTGARISRAIGGAAGVVHRAIVALLLLAMPLAAAAQDVEQRAREIVAVMQGQAIYTDVFDEAFTSRVSQEQLSAIFDQAKGQYGPLVGLESVEPTSPTAANIAIRFERGIASGVFNLANRPPYRVAGILVNNLAPADDSAEKLLADIRALPGETSILITPLDGGEPLLSYNADRHLGIGSAFKLYILSTLARQVAAGKRSWSDVVPITTIAHPSGASRDWPEGAPVTLHTLATLMISVSDNTATDNLLSAVGRGAVEAEVAASGHSDPALLVPFMSTREMIALKINGDVEAYRAADAAGRLAVLKVTADSKIDMFEFMTTFTGPPKAIDIEWLVSGEDMVNLMRRIHELDDPTAREIMAVSTSVPDNLSGGWQYIGFKGGSEPGVLNLSWLLQDHAGEWHVVTLSWNNPDAAVDREAFTALAMRAIALARPD